MNPHRASHDSSGPGNVGAVDQRQPTGSVILFISAVVIAGLTCVLYLWQQSQIVATQGDIRTLDAKISALTLQRNDLASQKSFMTSVTHVLSQAVKDGMVVGDSRQVKTLTVAVTVPNDLVAQAVPTPANSTVALPSTNAAITSWWQDAWDGLFSLLR
jgi:cell division protein FtsL